MKRLIVGSLALLACLVGAGGCGERDKGLNMGGQVTGEVTIDGKPVTAGDVVFLSENGQHSVVGTINEYGKYTVKEPPLGKCFVLVKTLEKKGSVRPKTPGKEGKFTGSAGMVLPEPDEVGLTYVPTPEKYEKKESSPLNFDVKKGNSEFKIELKKD